MDHPRFLYDLEHCSIRRALDVLGEKWTMLVLREAFYGLCRFDDLVGRWRSEDLSRAGGIQHANAHEPRVQRFVPATAPGNKRDLVGSR